MTSAVNCKPRGWVKKWSGLIQRLVGIASVRAIDVYAEGAPLHLPCKLHADKIVVACGRGSQFAPSSWQPGCAPHVHFMSVLCQSRLGSYGWNFVCSERKKGCYLVGGVVKPCCSRGTCSSDYDILFFFVNVYSMHFSILWMHWSSSNHDSLSTLKCLIFFVIKVEDRKSVV